ncbi:hypothetical protein EMPG_11415 [Blastomyces silverae]|uniref:Uncharacterized protein n=1 Tax=Blastomyces silverae TaxID=2060906 RepID=A0A0H1BRB8_9EURO|nr:hypothetical protein EMPG_11415 [Blastomyces silverae]
MNWEKGTTALSIRFGTVVRICEDLVWVCGVPSQDNLRLSPRQHQPLMTLILILPPT